MGGRQARVTFVMNVGKRAGNTNHDVRVVAQRQLVGAQGVGYASTTKDVSYSCASG